MTIPARDPRHAARGGWKIRLALDLLKAFVTARGSTAGTRGEEGQKRFVRCPAGRPDTPKNIDRPRRVGLPVLSGSGQRATTRKSRRRLDLRPRRGIELLLREIGWRFQTERKSIQKFGEIREYLHHRIDERFPIELTVYPKRELRFRPRSSTDGLPIVRVTLHALTTLLESEHAIAWQCRMAGPMRRTLRRGASRLRRGRHRTRPSRNAPCLHVRAATTAFDLGEILVEPNLSLHGLDAVLRARRVVHARAREGADLELEPTIRGEEHPPRRRVQPEHISRAQAEPVVAFRSLAHDSLFEVPGEGQIDAPWIRRGRCAERSTCKSA